MQAHLSGRLGPRVRCLCRWPAKIWGDFSLCKSCCRLGDYRGHRPTTSLCATSLALHRHTTRFGKSRAASPSSQHSSIRISISCMLKFETRGRLIKDLDLQLHRSTRIMHARKLRLTTSSTRGYYIPRYDRCKGDDYSHHRA